MRHRFGYLFIGFVVQGLVGLGPVQAQLSRKLKEIRDRAERVVDRQLDKLEDKASNADIRLGKDKAEDQQAMGSESPLYGTAEDETYSHTTEWNDESDTALSPQSFETYSKFDFLPGGRVIMFEDFAASALGDLPQNWNTGLSLETVQLSHLAGHWVRFPEGNGSHTPPFLEIPADFTLEYDLIFDYPLDKWSHIRNFSVLFSDSEQPYKELSKRETGSNTFTFVFAGATSPGVQYHKLSKTEKGFDDRVLNRHPYSEKTSDKNGQAIRVSFWKTGRRMRIYLDEQKVFDVPMAFLPDVTVRTIRFHTSLSQAGEHFYLGNIRLAESDALPIETQLSTTGMYSSQGIYFETGSDQISPESYPTLKRIADFLNSSGQPMTIAGHSDNVGGKDRNLELSARRATTVRMALANRFGVPLNQLASIGYGSQFPIGNNQTPEGRAQNRRVDFINLQVLDSESYKHHLSTNMDRTIF